MSRSNHSNLGTAASKTSSTWRFSALDTLFFRDSRPHGSAGAAVLPSLFPPSARTVAGLVRYLIGTAFEADWSQFGQTPVGQPYLTGGVDLLGLIGRHDDYGSLGFTGPWLAIEREQGWSRLFPAPRIVAVDDEQRLVGRATIGPPITCDLGRLRLLRLPRPLRAAGRIWLDRSAYEGVLRGENPKRGIFPTAELFTEEPRLGIGRTLAQHTATPGLLYQTRHLRPGGPHRQLAIETTVTAGNSMPDGLARLARLGGEGRLVGVTLEDGDLGLPDPPEPRRDDVGLTLNLLTPADLNGDWLPPGFEPEQRDEATVWRGTLHGTDVTVHSAAIGDAIREGGWDLAARKPRPVRSLAPAGSAWYVTVRQPDGKPCVGHELAPAIQALHGKQLSPNALGRGQIAVGTFDASTMPEAQASR